MSKTITSPVEHYPGTVTISDPLSFEQVFALEDGFEAVQMLTSKTAARVNYALLPALLGCIEKWEITGLPASPQPGDFPASPRKVQMATMQLLSWLVTEVTNLFAEVDEIPNA